MARIFDHHGYAHGAWMFALGLAAIFAELLWRVFAGKGYGIRHAMTTLAIALGHRAADGLGALAMAPVFALAWRLTPWHIAIDDWRGWAAGFFVVEFAYYWYHRLSHEVRWLWASHAVHHSTEELTLLSAVRLGWTNVFSGGWLIYALVVALGFDPSLVIALLAIDLRFQFFLHTEANITLGPLEWILNTPAHHRVHHACNASYVDKNYGGVLIVFDRLFGTFASERENDPPRYGLAHPLRTSHPVVLALGEWRRLFADIRRAPGWYAAAKIALGRP